MSVSARERFEQWYSPVCAVAAAILVLAACGARAADRAQADQRGTVMRDTSHDSVHHLDLSAPTLRVAVDSVHAGRRSDRFVKLELVSVTNPARLSLSFEVHRRSIAGEDVELGSVSPFPADHPGTFIVPTRGMLRAGDTLLVTLVCPDDGIARRDVRVTLGPIAFTNR
jgi:hypothetical protein